MKPSVKLAIGLFLMVALITAVDWRPLLAQLRGVDRVLALFAFIGYGFQFFVSGWKWSFSFRVLGVRLPTLYLVRLYSIAHFVGQFLPTTLGADAYRAYRIMNAAGSRTRPVSAIALDRLVGLGTLLVLGAWGAAQLADRFLLARTYLLLSFVGAVVSVVSLGAIRRGALRRLTRHFAQSTWFKALHQDYRQLNRAGWRWAPFLGVSLLFQTISIAITHLLFLAVGADPTLAQSALIVALAGLASTVPISINGLGITEGSIASASFALGLSPSIGLAVGILSRLLVLPWTLACGGLYAAEQSPAQSATSGARQSFFDEASDAVIIWEMDGEGIMYWNGAAERLYGYTGQETLGQTTHALLDTRVSEGMGIGELERVLARDGIWVGDLRHTRRDGTHVKVQGCLALISQQNGRWLVLEVNRDATDAERTELVQSATEAKLLSLQKQARYSSSRKDSGASVPEASP